jgi:LmbE family N-acetylglucosaminyl deacetylase
MRLEFDAFCQRIGLHRRMLVVAPHPDDETIGCGGLIAFATSRGLDVYVVVVTDGAASHPGSQTWPPRRIALARKAEMARALRTLGVSSLPTYLDLPDAATLGHPADRRRQAQLGLSTVIASLLPDVVLTTWRREPHCDHRLSFGLTQDAMLAAGSTARRVEYIVWTYLIGSTQDQPTDNEVARLQLDIDVVRERKRAALSMYASQLGGLIRDDPNGFSLTRDQIEAMTSGDEHFVVEHIQV